MKNMKAKFIIIYVSLVAFSSVSMGAIGQWQNYTNMNNAQGIIADSSEIWCITTGGLLKYDTETEEATKYLNSDGLGDINLVSIEIDSAGTVFIGGTNNTLTRISSDGQISVDEYEFSNEILYALNDLYADGDILWVATGVGVAKYLIYNNDGEFQETYSNLGDLPREESVQAIISIADHIWAGTGSGLAYADKNNQLLQNPDNWSTITAGENGLTDAGITCMALANDTLMVGTSTGVFWMGADSIWNSIGPVITIRDLQYLNDTMYAATNNGVYKRSGGVWNLVSTDSLLSVRSRGVTADNQGRLWASFEDGAFAVYDNSYWSVKTIEGPASNRIQDIAIDSTGNIWLAHTIPGYSEIRGVTKYNGIEWTNYNYLNSGIGRNAAVEIEYDYIHDLVWFASWGNGLFSFDGDTTWQVFNDTNSPLRGVAPSYVSVPDITLDAYGNIWALDQQAYEPDGDNPVMGVYDPDEDNWLIYSENPAQINDNYQQVIYNNDNITYVCGALQNIYLLDHGADPLSVEDDIWLDQIRGTEDIAVEEVRDVIYDDEKLYIASASGLAYYDFVNNRLVRVELPDGYRSQANCITLDGLGNKWVGTDSGVVVLASKVDLYNQKWEYAFKPSNSDLLGSRILSIEVDNNTGFAYIGTENGFSVYESGFVAPSPDLNDMAVYPNPVYVGDDSEINFQRVPSDAIISIFTISGDLVAEINYEEDKSWNLKNESGRTVAAGIYIFYVKSADKSGLGKFAVIR